MKRLIKFFVSLRLTVVLLAFAIVLVFIGTLAQVDEGLYNAQSRYFRQWLILGFDIFGHKIPIIFPGGYLIGTLLFINLLAAHIYRFQLSVKKIGIQLAHLGVILLLAGQLATDMLAHEMQMRFTPGETETYAESAQKYELALTTDTGAKTEQTIAIPETLLAHSDEIRNKNLPFTIRVKHFWKNSDLGFRAPMTQNGPPMTTNGVAQHFDFVPRPEVKAMDDKNVPTALIEIVGGGDAASPSGSATGASQPHSFGDWVVSGWTADTGEIEAVRRSYARQAGAQIAGQVIGDLTRPQSVFAGGKKFTFELRPERTYFPFSLTLLNATNSFYEGTEIPKDFRSRVRIQNPRTGEDREALIYMNAPLRYAGLTFYQYQMTAGELAAQAGVTPESVLQVVRNPSWLTPYIGCALVAAGLVIQFLMHLAGFVSKRKQSSTPNTARRMN